MTIVQGNEVNVYVFDEGEYKLYACGTSCSVEVAVDLISIATVSTGEYRDFESGLKDVTIYMDGVVTLDQLNKVQYYDIMDTIGVRKQIKVELVNTYGDELSFETEAIAERVIMDGAAEGVATWGVTWRGCGTLTINETTFEALLDDSGDPIVDENGQPIRV
jgi:hypothetical protein